jgi:hypothetical protein
MARRPTVTPFSKRKAFVPQPCICIKADQVKFVHDAKLVIDHHPEAMAVNHRPTPPPVSPLDLVRLTMRRQFHFTGYNPGPQTSSYVKENVEDTNAPGNWKLGPHINIVTYERCCLCGLYYSVYGKPGSDERPETRRIHV